MSDANRVELTVEEAPERELGADRIDAGGADDVAWGGSGDDALLGRRGPDALHGGTGNDVALVYTYVPEIQQRQLRTVRIDER